MKTTKRDYCDENLMETALEEVMEEMGVNPAPGRDNEGWIKALEARLRDQRMEFKRLLDHADENVSLLSCCRERRREIEETKRRLIAHVMMRECRN